ncbi:MAG TPA: C1 family peptidase [Phnomibacter sp.]|nr:C1 family peptidase [Phnomibacter sp.]
MEESTFGMGWLPDLPDFRDYTVESTNVPTLAKAIGRTETVKSMLAAADIKSSKPAKAATSADLRTWCSPIENQGSIGSCTAHAGVGMIEYFERRAFGRHLDASRLFLYKVTRNLLGWTGDTGAFLRTTMGAMALFGTPPESFWPYNISKYDIEPSAFLYAYGQSYQAIQFYRLDPVGTARPDILASLKTHLTAGLPAMFGFTCYSSLYSDSGNKGNIPYPAPTEKTVGGHAVMAVGFDDSKTITNPTSNKKTKGAILIRNSWGTGWGDAGYGWLPYEYVLNGLADDFWCLIKKEYIDTKQFGI